MVEDASGFDIQKSTALDVNGGQVAIAYALYKNDWPHYTTTVRLASRPLTGTAWTTETVENVVPGSSDRPRPALALDGAGRAHLAYYYAPDETLRYAIQTGSFTIGTVDESREIGQIALAVGSDASTHLAYLSKGLRYATVASDTVTWTKMIAVPGVHQWASLDLALDAANVPHVAYYKGTGEPLLYHATPSTSFAKHPEASAERTGQALNSTAWITRQVDRPGGRLCQPIHRSRDDRHGPRRLHRSGRERPGRAPRRL